MLELAADSDRSKTAEKGAISSPSSASKRATSLLASSASAQHSGRQRDGELGDGSGDRGFVSAGLSLGRAQVRQSVAGLDGRSPRQRLVPDRRVAEVMPQRQDSITYISK